MEAKEMKNRKYDKEFKLDCLKYCAERKELTQVEAAKKSWRQRQNAKLVDLRIKTERRKCVPWKREPFIRFGKRERPPKMRAEERKRCA